MALNTPNANPLTKTEKTAIVLITLGAQASAGVLRHMSEDEAATITAAIAKLGQVTKQQEEAVLTEYYQDLHDRQGCSPSGLEYAQKLLKEAFPPELASRLGDRLVRSLGQDTIDIQSFRKIDPQQLAKFIHDEHPQTIAIVLSYLDPSQAAILISSLPPEIQADVAIRLAALEQISPESFRTIASVIGQKLRNLGGLTRESGGVRVVADLFNRLEPATRGPLLDVIETENPPLFENIRRLMFVFEDLTTLDPTAIKELTTRLDRKLLLIAMKGASDELRNHLSQGLSQRGIEMLKEDLASAGSGQNQGRGCRAAAGYLNRQTNGKGRPH